jgi:hypothetical protein
MIPITPVAPSEWTKHFSNVYSQFGEDGILAEIFRRIGTTNKQCFEVGAADGKWFSNSRKLIDEGWRAALIEADEKNWPELKRLGEKTGDRVIAVLGQATPDGPNSLDSILSQCHFEPAMDLGIIDVDGQDYYLWNGMMKYRPRVMMVEFDAENENFVPDLNGPGQAGLAAILSIAASKGYGNVATTPTNAIFILNSERDKFYRSLDGFVAPPPKALPQPVERMVPTIATGVEKEIKIAAILSRPRFGLNVFFDCASEALSPWHIPLQSFYSPYWGQCLETAMEDNLDLDWILTLDFDTLFTSKHMQLLIDCLSQNPQIDAVAALQCRRGRPLPLAVRADGTMPLNGGPVQVTTAHFGLTILRTEAIRKMKKPWLWAQPAPNGGWGEGRLDEDIYFWGKWRDSGNTLFVHTGCRVGHVEEMASQFDEGGKVHHSYLSDWRKKNGHAIKSFE